MGRSTGKGMGQRQCTEQKRVPLVTVLFMQCSGSYQQVLWFSKATYIYYSAFLIPLHLPFPFSFFFFFSSSLFFSFLLFTRKCFSNRWRKAKELVSSCCFQHFHKLWKTLVAKCCFKTVTINVIHIISIPYSCLIKSFLDLAHMLVWIHNRVFYTCGKRPKTSSCFQHFHKPGKALVAGCFFSNSNNQSILHSCLIKSFSDLAYITVFTTVHFTRTNQTVRARQNLVWINNNSSAAEKTDKEILVSVQ